MGIVEILDARMADLVRRETIGRGYDPSDFALFAFGGAGPLHVGAYGRRRRREGDRRARERVGVLGLRHRRRGRRRGRQASDPMIAPFDLDRLTAVYDRLEQTRSPTSRPTGSAAAT